MTINSNIEDLKNKLLMQLELLKNEVEELLD